MRLPESLQTLFPVADLAAVADLVADRRRVGLWPFLSCCGPCFRVCMAVLALFGRFWARVVSLYALPRLGFYSGFYGRSARLYISCRLYAFGARVARFRPLVGGFCAVGGFLSVRGCSGRS